jgi:hypothetical protein
MLTRQETKEAIKITKIELAQALERKDIVRVMELNLAISMLKDTLIDIYETITKKEDL